MRKVNPHYEVFAGIRPPRKSGKVRGVAMEVVPGGALELWHCDHDHGPGVKRCPDLTPEQRTLAEMCAAEWVTQQIRDGRLPEMPVITEEKWPEFDAGSCGQC